MPLCQTMQSKILPRHEQSIASRQVPASCDQEQDVCSPTGHSYQPEAPAEGFRCDILGAGRRETVICRQAYRRQQAASLRCVHMKTQRTPKQFCCLSDPCEVEGSEEKRSADRRGVFDGSYVNFYRALWPGPGLGPSFPDPAAAGSPPRLVRPFKGRYDQFGS